MGPVRRDILDLSLPDDTGRPLLGVLVSLAGAVAVALLVPLVIALVGVLVDRALRSVAEAFGWL